jgi:hypothetical protein
LATCLSGVSKQKQTPLREPVCTKKKSDMTSKESGGWEVSSW